MTTLKAKEGYVYSNGEIYSDVVYLSDIDSVDNWQEIERDGVRYSDAIDPVDSGREYEETDERVDVMEAGGEYGDMPTLAEA